MSFASQIGALATRVSAEFNTLRAEIAGSGSINVNRYQNAGRFYMNTNNSWVTDSDDNYGTNLHNFSETAGTGATPTREWEHLGMLVQPGEVIRRLVIAGRTNNNMVLDLEIAGYLVKPNPSTRWNTGFDNDNEILSKQLFQDSFKTPSSAGQFILTGNMNDLHRQEYIIPSNVATASDLSFLRLYVRPVGTLTSRRYFSATYMWETN